MQQPKSKTPRQETNQDAAFQSRGKEMTGESTSQDTIDLTAPNLITVVTANAPCNKRFRINKDGELAKTAANPGGPQREEISTALGTDYVDGWVTVDGRRTTARLKVNAAPGTWMLLDRDHNKELPKELADMTDDEWLVAFSTRVYAANWHPKRRPGSR